MDKIEMGAYYTIDRAAILPRRGLAGVGNSADTNLFFSCQSYRLRLVGHGVQSHPNRGSVQGQGVPRRCSRD